MPLKHSDWLLDPHSCPGFDRAEVKAHVDRPPYIHHTEHVYVRIPKRYALVNIQQLVEAALARSKVGDGLCFVSTMHITAGVYINDAEPGLLGDISDWIENLAPFGRDYGHHQTGEDNADAHLKSFLTNHAVTAPVRDGRLDFGTWQQIFYAEYDGRREKRILIKVTGLG